MFVTDINSRMSINRTLKHIYGLYLSNFSMCEMQSKLLGGGPTALHHIIYLIDIRAGNLAKPWETLLL